jgi:adenosylhomocysteine nucleosidase
MNCRRRHEFAALCCYNGTMLQWVLHQWLRQTAHQKVMESVAAAAQQVRDGATEPEADETSEPTPPCDIALLFALQIEAAGILDAAPHLTTLRNATFVEHLGAWQKKQIVVAECGVGQKAAAQATADVIALHQPQWVVSAGFAGALVEELPRGHMLMPDVIVDEEGSESSVGFNLSAEALAQSPKLHVGKLLTVNEVVRTAEQKRALAERYQAVAVDMETAAIARVCREQKTRFLSIRIISDALDDELPLEIEALMQPGTLARKAGRLAGALWNRPSSVKDMWQLREDAIKYADRLAKFLRGVLPQLPGHVGNLE